MSPRRSPTRRSPARPSTGDAWVIAMAAWARAHVAGSAAELRERVDEAASLLEKTGNADDLADLFHNATYRALCNGSDRDALEFVHRAMPLARDLDHPYQWMLLRGKAGLAALLNGDTDTARQAFREQLRLCRELVVLPAAFEGTVRPRRGRGGPRRPRPRRAALGRRGRTPLRRCSIPSEARLDATFIEPARARLGATPGTPPSARAPRWVSRTRSPTPSMNRATGRRSRLELARSGPPRSLREDGPAGLVG